jgi:3-methylfumaryl-CoA hydratase
MIKRVSKLSNVVGKQGRSGPLIIVTIRDEIFGSQGLALTEEMDIVFLDGNAADATPPRLRPAEPLWQRRIYPDSPFLFCFSALTYNSHRIHYDQAYTTECEGYPKLLVHGPLQAVLLLDLVRRTSARIITEFSCRALRPVFEGTAFWVEGVPQAGGASLWTCDDSGALTMIASAKFGGGTSNEPDAILNEKQC